MGVFLIVSAVTSSTAHEKLIGSATFKSLHFPLRESDQELKSAQFFNILFQFFFGNLTNCCDFIFI
jgi:hypothetical protein